MPKTQAEINTIVDSYIGKWVDFDGYYAFQCMDLAVDYVYKLTDGKTRLWGNAIDSINNKLPEGWKVVRNEKSTVPKKGWIPVWTKGVYAKYGHIGIVYNGGDTNYFQVAEQNFDGLANSPVKLRWDDYTGLTHFIVPPVAKSPSKTVSKAPAKKPNNRRKIMLVAGHGLVL